MRDKASITSLSSTIMNAELLLLREEGAVRATFTTASSTSPLSFLDSNLWRLFRFREAVLGDPSLKCRIICFPEQVPFLKSYLGDHVSYATANMAKVEKVLGIQAVNYLES